MTTQQYFFLRLKSTLFFFLPICFMIILSGCKQKTNAPNNERVEKENIVETSQSAEVADEAMKAPEITPDSAGLIVLSQCPTENEHIKVKVSEDQSSAEIYKDDQLIQTIADKEDGLVAPGGEPPIYFMDANFDGLTDIFIGPGQSRTYSTLLIWDDAQKQFVRIGTLGTPSLQNFMMHPATKSVFEGGSNSWCNMSFTKSVWEEGKLKIVEDLTCVSEPEEYEENKVSNMFTVKNSTGEVTSSVGTASELSKEWQNVLKAVGL